MFFGWKVVAGAFALAVFAWGIGFYAPSVLVFTLHTERGLALTLVSGAVTVHFLASAATVTFVPGLHRRIGVAATTAAGGIALACGTLGWGFAEAGWQLAPAAMMTGAGFAATGGVAINAIVAPWFARRRALAMSLALNGATFGGFLLVPLWMAAIARLGLSNAAVVIASATVIVFAAVALTALRATPEALGLRPDGETRAPPAEPRGPASPVPGAGLASRAFLTLALAFALGLFVQIGIVTHLVTLLAPRLGAEGAAATLSLATIAALAGRTVTGMVGARVAPRRLAAANFLIQGAGVAIVAVAQAPAALVVGVALFGIGIGNMILLPPLIAHADFAPALVPRAVARLTAINQAFFAFAPAVFGAMRETAGSYGPVLILAVGLELAAAAIVLVAAVSSPRQNV
jgi:sugar phosphate permease